MGLTATLKERLVNDDLMTGEVARQAGLGEKRIRIYADAGLLPCKRTPGGVRIFPADAPRMAREIHAKRTKNRGGNRRRA